MRRIAFGTIAALALTSCGTGHGPVAHGSAFTAAMGVAGGLSSGNWGDGSSGPTGMHLGCIDGRHFALYVTARNNAGRPVTVSKIGGAQPHADLMERVAAQVRLEPPPPKGDAFVTAFRGWTRAPTRAVEIPPGRSVGLQSNFVMHHCSRIPAGHALLLNRSVTITFRVGGKTYEQRLVVPSARIFLRRT